MEINLTDTELKELHNYLVEVLGCSRLLAALILCRGCAAFSETDTKEYGTRLRECFEMYVQGRINNGKQ